MDEYALRIELFGDEIDRLYTLHPISGEKLNHCESMDIFPASHYVVSGGLDESLEAIQLELDQRSKELLDMGLIVEAQRLKQRTKYDIEMMQQMGYCKGIENYARHLSKSKPGEPPGVLLDFFPDDFITFIDESHVTVPQIGGMYQGDRSRETKFGGF